jgi:uncharacterized protein HemX
MQLNRYGEFKYRKGMGEVSLIGPLLLLVFVIGAGAGLYHWKKYKAERDEEELEPEPKSIKRIRNAIELSEVADENERLADEVEEEEKDEEIL